MLNYEKLINECRAILSPNQLLLNELMTYHTTFNIGGRADVMLLPKDITELETIVRILSKYNHHITIIGNGSNLLISDNGIRGVVIKFSDKYKSIFHYEDSIVVNAGVLLSEVSKFALSKELTGLEFACGIPGSIGGAVFMNAGAYDGEMSQVVERVTTMTRKGEIKNYSVNDMDFSYRHSIFQCNDEIIYEIAIKLRKGCYGDIYDRMIEFSKKRSSKQPLELPSAGSVFKRPEGYFAGTLIEQAGLKGLTIGGAQVSYKHSGFIVNIGHATAADVHALIREVQKQVYNKFGVSLKTELRIIN